VLATIDAPAVPVRTCVGCRQRQPQAQLLRVVLTPAGQAAVSRTAPGRGAWLCAPLGACLDVAQRRRGFERAWRQPVPPGALDELVRPRAGDGRRDDDEKG
jgi:predicted RNA-binding protein YlxR (DUF448 family)